MSDVIRLIRVQATQIDALQEYVIALYEHKEDFESMINIEAGVKSLMKNEQLAMAYFIMSGDVRVGYTILTKYHSVEKGGLTFYIDELYVEEKHRRSKVGTHVMDQILAIAKEQGVRGLWAQTETFNDGAQRFFVNHGFRENKYKNFERPV